MLRHAPDPLAALDGDLGADGQVQDVLAEPEGAAAAGERDAVLDVVPDYGLLVVHDRDREQRLPPEPHRADAVREQGLGAAGSTGNAAMSACIRIERTGSVNGIPSTSA